MVPRPGFRPALWYRVTPRTGSPQPIRGKGQRATIFHFGTAILPAEQSQVERIVFASAPAGARWVRIADGFQCGCGCVVEQPERLVLADQGTERWLSLLTEVHRPQWSRQR
jgi:hypothetical protein